MWKPAGMRRFLQNHKKKQYFGVLCVFYYPKCILNKYSCNLTRPFYWSQAYKQRAFGFKDLNFYQHKRLCQSFKNVPNTPIQAGI